LSGAEKTLMSISIDQYFRRFNERLEAAAQKGDLEALFRELGQLRSLIAGSIGGDDERSGNDELAGRQTRIHAELDRSLFLAVKLLLERRTRSLAEQAERDPLTTLFNRAAFDRRLRDEVERAKRYRRELSLVLFDVDHFKSINDRYGHQIGDRVLLKVAGVLQSSLRQSDSAFRYGGDEFAAICPETRGDAMESVLNRIERAFNAYRLAARLDDGFGVSWGVASFPDDATATGELIRIADARLYDRKKRRHRSSRKPTISVEKSFHDE
jgi:diguanylate cyclase (GGDEF)-like protein